MPWDMHRLRLREWKMIVDAANQQPHDDGGVPGGLPQGWENLPMEEG